MTSQLDPNQVALKEVSRRPGLSFPLEESPEHREDLDLTLYLSDHVVCVPFENLSDLLSKVSCEVEIGTKGQLAFVRAKSPVVRQNKESKKLISVVIPIYFEELLIDELVNRLVHATLKLTNYRWELIFVNDGSTDASLEKLLWHRSQNPQIRVVDLSRNFGHQSAITAGMDVAKGDAVVVIDGDLQDPPEVIAQMIEKWEEGYHVAYGVRAARAGETHFKLITAKIFYRFMSSLADVEIPVDAGDFRLMDRKVVDQLKALPERSRYVRGLVKWVGFRDTPVYYQRDPRYAGETKYTLRKMIRFAFDGLTSFSDKPLYMAGYLGILFSLASIVGIIWVMHGHFFRKDALVTGWASLMAMLFFLAASQLLSLSVIGQYIGRIYKETRARPNYIIKEIY
jgi:glycosyltransferase involved in cell wall biosynthesis